MDKKQVKSDIKNVDSQMSNAAEAFGTSKWVLYGVGIFALLGIVYFFFGK